MKIAQQNHITLQIISALKTCVHGKGIRELHHIKIKRGSYGSSIEFSRKDGSPINPLDFFIFGFYAGQKE